FVLLNEFEGLVEQLLGVGAGKELELVVEVVATGDKLQGQLGQGVTDNAAFFAQPFVELIGVIGQGRRVADVHRTVIELAAEIGNVRGHYGGAHMVDHVDGVPLIVQGGNSLTGKFAHRIDRAIIDEQVARSHGNHAKQGKL